jgi:hypothetical protein
MRNFFCFFIKRTKKISNGECPIYCRLTMDGHSAEFGAKVSIKEVLWNPATGRTNERGNCRTEGKMFISVSKRYWITAKLPLKI